MCDLLCYTSLAVFEAARRVKSTHLIKSINHVLKPEKKRKYGNKRYFDINLYLKDRLHMIEFTAC